MTSWNEADHPRDDDGKFIYKGGETPKNGYEDKIQAMADILYPTMKDKHQEINYDNIRLGNYNNEELSPEDILYPTMRNKKSDGIFTCVAVNGKFSDKTKQKAVNFIAEKEGFREKAYKPLENDVWTIGYGHTKGVKQGDKITKEQARILLFDDFEKYSAPLNSVIVPLTENQKIALSSFIYNVGTDAFKNSTLLKKLNKGDIEGASHEFERWVYKDKKVVPGLVNRRKAEKNIFLAPDD